MKKNMYSIDAVIRLLFVAVVAYLYFSGIVAGTLGIVLLVVAVIFLLTAITGFCPIYRALGLSTRKSKRQ